MSKELAFRDQRLWCRPPRHSASSPSCPRVTTPTLGCPRGLSFVLASEPLCLLLPPHLPVPEFAWLQMTHLGLRFGLQNCPCRCPDSRPGHFLSLPSHRPDTIRNRTVRVSCVLALTYAAYNKAALLHPCFLYLKAKRSGNTGRCP